MANGLIQRIADAPIIYQGQRVVTLRMMDDVHQRPEGTAGRNFRENRQRLVKGEDYFELEQPDEIRRVGLARADGSTPDKVVLLTEFGYLLLVKSFRDDLAWQVQRALVSCYFRAGRPGSGDVLLDSLRSLVTLRESQLALEQRTTEVAHLAGEAKHLAEAAFAKAEANHGCFSILGFARRRGMEMPISEAGRHGKRLTAICRNLGIQVQQLADPRFGLVNTYPESVLEDYFGENRKN